ncbi:MAG: energy transducer TonB [Acidobacteria bacterium]|nr:energy transducer TonB [Acidobacteriota bacterium]
MKLIFPIVIIIVIAVSRAAAQSEPPRMPEKCDFSAFAPVPMELFPDESVVKRVAPVYPRRARARMVEGRVSVKLLIDEDGVVEKACAFAGPQVFRPAAEKAALQWRFKPGSGLAFTVQGRNPDRKRYASAFISFTFKFQN